MLVNDPNENRPRAVVVGDVMTDVVVRLEEDFAPDSDTNATITTAAGGSGSNVAVFLARGGVASALTGAVGDDERGRALVTAIVREGVAPHITVVPGTHSGTVISVVSRSGRRSMLTDRGANRFLDGARLPVELFRAPGHLHLSGYELIDEETRSEAKAIFARAGASSMTRSVDCSSAAPLREMGAQAFFEATAGADALFANSEEVDVLTGSTEPEGFSPALAARYAISLVTLGSRGVCLVSGATDAVVVPPRDVPIVDTTGAGDAFTGAFLASWLRDGDPSQAIGSGLDASASVVQTLGARPAF